VVGFVRVEPFFCLFDFFFEGVFAGFSFVAAFYFAVATSFFLDGR
jgi:hypothetical protein